MPAPIAAGASSLTMSPFVMWVRRHNAPNRPNRTARTLPYEPAITSNAFSLIM